MTGKHTVLIDKRGLDRASPLAPQLAAGGGAS